MAKRYARINWQGKPSVATPVSPTNLNKMDKGIDDCDNAIEEIYAKRVNNTVTTNPDTFLAGPVGKQLQDQIATINNNLSDIINSVEIANGTILDFVKSSNNHVRGFIEESYIPIDTPVSAEGFIDIITDATTLRKLCTFTPYNPSQSTYQRAYFMGNWTSEWVAK